ncbi:MAG: TolC family protein [Bacteroidota bacterium]
MLKTILYIYLFICISTVLNAQETVSQLFTLNKSLEYAYEHNADVLNKVLDRKIADKQINEVLSEGLPQLNADAGLNYNYQVQTSLLDASNFDPTAPEGAEIPVQFGQAYGAQAQITLEQLIFKGSYFVGIQAAKAFKEFAEKDYTNSKVDLAEAVSKAYYNALISKEQEQLSFKNYDRIDSLYRETKGLYENGFAESLDLLRSQVEFNNIKVERDRATEFKDASYRMLKLIMGYPANSPIELSDKLEDLDLGMDLSAVETFNYQNRSDYKLLNANLSLAELDVKNEKVQYYPEVNAFVNYGSNTNTGQASQIFDFGDRWFGFGTLGATVTVPIFDGFRKSSRIKQREITIQKIQNQFEQLENSIDAELIEKQDRLRTDIRNVELQRENVELAEEIYRAAKLKYDEGIGSSLEVTDANTSLKTAQTNYFNAVFDALITRIELKKALGILLEN